MALASYIVNWDEFKDLTEEIVDTLGGRGTPWDSGLQQTEGFMQEIPAIQAKYRAVNWTVPFNIAMVGITFNQSAWKSEDYWELWLGGEQVFETVHTKELGEHKQWEVLHYVQEGEKIELILHNNSGNSRDVWVDIDYLLVGEASPIVPDEPNASPRVHFDGLIIGGVPSEGIDEYSIPMELSYMHNNMDMPATEILAFGEYPDASLALPNSIKTTLDSIAVEEGARVLFYSEKDFQGDLVYDLKGKTVTYSNAVYEGWNINQSFRVKEVWDEPYEEQFPLDKRTFLRDPLDPNDNRYNYWTTRMMHVYSQYGSFKIIPDTN